MKKLIYQYYCHKPQFDEILDSDYPYWELSKQSISKYASLCESEYKFLSHDFGYSPFFGIFLPFLENWYEQYDYLCFIDSDILATKNSENIFDYASNNQLSVSLMNSTVCNSGVVVIPSTIFDKFNTFVQQNIDQIENPRKSRRGGFDQEMVNQFINKHSYTPLDKKFNWHMTRYDKLSRFDQVLIHYHRKNKNQIKLDWNDNRILK